jgi:hypothetical protein
MTRPDPFILLEPDPGNPFSHHPVRMPVIFGTSFFRILRAAPSAKNDGEILSLPPMSIANP